MADASGGVVTVEILGQQYPIRSSLDTSYVTELAAYVDQKMQVAGERIAGGDSLRVGRSRGPEHCGRVLPSSPERCHT